MSDDNNTPLLDSSNETFSSNQSARPPSNYFDRPLPPGSPIFPPPFRRQPSIQLRLLLLFFCLIVIILGIIGIWVVLPGEGIHTQATPTPTGNTATTPSPSPQILQTTIQNTTTPGLVLETQWRAPLVKEQSTAIFACLCSETFIPTPEPALTKVPTKLTPVGTPGAIIGGAFGPNYDAFATAQLSASSFTIDPKIQQVQSLDQFATQFTWIITPNYSGTQTLDITIQGIWITKNGEKVIDRPLAGCLLQLKVLGIPGSSPPSTTSSSSSSTTSHPPADTPPFFSLGQFTLGDFLIVTLGAILSSTPLLWKRITKKLKENSQKQQSPLILPPNIHSKK